MNEPTYPHCELPHLGNQCPNITHEATLTMPTGFKLHSLVCWRCLKLQREDNVKGNQRGLSL